MNIRLEKRSGVDRVRVELPASKSLSARALVIAALCPGCDINGVAVCDDTDALRRGIVTRGDINIGAAGTAMRFLTAFHAASAGHDVRLDGSERMRRRPIGALVDALRDIGAAVEYLVEPGFPPLHVTGQQLSRFDVTICGDISSQYITALMLIAPRCGGGTIRLSTPLTSRPYVEMTAALMRHFGATVTVEDDTITVGETAYAPREYTVEADWSAASYWYGVAALSPGLEVELPRLTLESLQGDARVATIMRQLGVVTREYSWGVTVVHEAATAACACPLYLDLADVPDIAQTLVVTACLLGRRFNFTGLHTLRIKETDRIDALCSEMARLGYDLHGGSDNISWDGARCTPQQLPAIDTHDDHRMAMSMSLAALHSPIVINDAEVVTKSYPTYWDHLAQVTAINA